jgi:hypothetical protein
MNLQFLILILVFCFRGASSELQELLNSDAFFHALPLSIQEAKPIVKSLEYTVSQDFYAEIKKTDPSVPQLQRLSEEWLRSHLPLGLPVYCIGRGYSLEVHFGSVEESLFLLRREGVDKAWHIIPDQGGPVELLLVEPVEAQGKNIAKPGRLILTRIQDEGVLSLVQTVLHIFLSKIGSDSQQQVAIYDFHLIGRKDYVSARFKEVFHSIPFDVNTAILGRGEEFFGQVMQRKFASMSLTLMHSLFGPDFLIGLKRALVEEGFLGIADWSLSSYQPLNTKPRPILGGSNFLSFLRFQRELVLILGQKPQSPLAQVLLVGNELAIHKELKLKADLMESFRLKGSRANPSKIFSAYLPVKTRKGLSRILCVDQVRGKALGSLMQVLERVGLKTVVYVGEAHSLGADLKAGSLVFPDLLESGDGEKLSGLLESNIIVEPSLASKGLRGVSGVLPLVAGPQPADFADEGAYAFALSAKELQPISWGMVSICLSDLQSSRSQSSSLQVSRTRSKYYQVLVDFLLKSLGIEDILPEAQEADFGFSSLEDKIEKYKDLYNLDPQKTVLFNFALKHYLRRNLKSEQDQHNYLKTADLRFAGKRSLEPFSYFLDKPYTDVDVIAHLSQIEKALRELEIYLELLSESDLRITFYGDWLNGVITPLSPVLFSVKGLSQAAYQELLASPFGSGDHARRFLLRMIPDGSRLDASEDLAFPFSGDNELTSQYLKHLASLGLDWDAGKGVFTISKPKIDRSDLEGEISRWAVGCDTFLRLARGDFLSQKSQVFSLAPWSQKRVERLSASLRTGIAQLTQEGLELKEKLMSSSVPLGTRQSYSLFLLRQISHLEDFVQVFDSY